MKNLMTSILILFLSHNSFADCKATYFIDTDFNSNGPIPYTIEHLVPYQANAVPSKSRSVSLKLFEKWFEVTLLDDKGNMIGGSSRVEADLSKGVTLSIDVPNKEIGYDERLEVFCKNDKPSEDQAKVMTCANEIKGKLLGWNVFGMALDYCRKYTPEQIQCAKETQKEYVGWNNFKIALDNCH